MDDGVFPFTVSAYRNLRSVAGDKQLLPVCAQEMNLFRTWCATLFGYDWVGVPLVYTQVSPEKRMQLV